jgi:DNA-directed RNA polymerase specialized sigma24 family protein
MRATSADLEQFEGLIFKTTVRIKPYLEDDFDDVRQALRIKVWKAYESYDPARSKLPLQRYVFGCLVNFTKDLKKRRHRGLLYLSDFMQNDTGSERPVTGSFEATYLSVSEEEAFLHIEDEVPMLPNTLTSLEKRVIGFLMLDYSATEISRTLGIGPTRLRSIRNDIERKMMDWRPTAVHAPEPVLEAA